MKRRSNKTESNRENALKSTGPTSEEGKAVVALNGVAHGLRTLKPVIPWLEREEDWLAHRAAFFEQIAPVGALEAALAERIAFGFWRLGRCAEAEPRILAAIRERRHRIAMNNLLVEEHLKLAGEAPADVLPRLESERDRLKAVADLWETILSRAAREKVDPATANDLVDSIIAWERQEEVLDEFNEAFRWPPSRVSELRAMVEWLMQRSDESCGADLAELAQTARKQADHAARRVSRIEEEAARAVDSALAEIEVVGPMMRYETAIHRSLQKDLHELQRLQAFRLGYPATVPIAIDLTGDSQTS